MNIVFSMILDTDSLNWRIYWKERQIYLLDSPIKTKIFTDTASAEEDLAICSRSLHCKSASPWPLVLVLLSIQGYVTLAKSLTPGDLIKYLRKPSIHYYIITLFKWGVNNIFLCNISLIDLFSSQVLPSCFLHCSQRFKSYYSHFKTFNGISLFKIKATESNWCIIQL